MGTAPAAAAGEWPAGGQWRDHRQGSKGIRGRLRVGALWRDVPDRYGPWHHLVAPAQAAADACGDIDWVICIDGTIVRALQHAAGARRRPSEADRVARVEHPPGDGQGRPLAVILTSGERHESTQLGAVLDTVRVPRPGGRGRPRKRPDHVIADKGYSYPACRQLLGGHDIPHTIPERRDQRRRRDPPREAGRELSRRGRRRGDRALAGRVGLASRRAGSMPGHSRQRHSRAGRVLRCCTDEAFTEP